MRINKTRHVSVPGPGKGCSRERMIKKARQMGQPMNERTINAAVTDWTRSPQGRAKR